MAIKISAIATKACLGYLACSAACMHGLVLNKFDKMFNSSLVKGKEDSPHVAHVTSDKAKSLVQALLEFQKRPDEVLDSKDIGTCIAIYSYIFPLVSSAQPAPASLSSSKNIRLDPTSYDKLRLYFIDEVNINTFKVLPKPLSPALLFLSQKFEAQKDFSPTSSDADIRAVLEVLLDSLREIQILPRKQQFLELFPKFISYCQSFHVTHEFALWVAPLRTELIILANDAVDYSDDPKKQRKYIRKKFVKIAKKYSTDKNFYLPPEFVFVKQSLWLLDATLLSTQENIHKPAKELYNLFIRLLVTMPSDNEDSKQSYSKDNKKSSQSSYQNQGRQVAKQAFGLLQSIF